MTGPESDSKNESDVEDDPKVAASRAGENEDGSYVGRASSDDDFDAGETGAEARGDAGS
ncbi:hypothetical protein [Mycolicibacterium diernhoferi]|uniref:Uncharacterized protein n=1 Tax=Mycolicibacterium diernhoferi TaxID=1801 RepID=A0A2A7NLS0_9MYCO|nr:hypothetical protein [Mycolicibacterium diernhoferi]PEG51361.1 hypothetical protein CRI78_27065 [Mycolicibacterium diernhoferi]QYL22781.1 hypothetical protein K0O62_28440 [Mycolicibacterium diernhoferi]